MYGNTFKTETCGKSSGNCNLLFLRLSLSNSSQIIIMLPRKVLEACSEIYTEHSNISEVALSLFPNTPFHDRRACCHVQNAQSVCILNRTDAFLKNPLMTVNITLKLILSSIELPKLRVSGLSAVVRTFPGYGWRWSVTGTPPIYTTLIHNSSVVFNTTKTRDLYRLVKDGNYSFVATNRFGTDVKEFSAIITGKTLL